MSHPEPHTHRGVPFEISPEQELTINGQAIPVEKQGKKYWTPAYGFMEFDSLEALARTLIDKRHQSS